MPTYIYKARNEAGKPIKGVLKGPSREDVALKLKGMGYMVSRVDETFSSEIRFEGLEERFGRIKSQDMVMLSFQLSNMIGAGISLLMSLKILENQFESRRLKKVIGEVARSVEGGSSFSEALEMHPKIFSKLMIYSVRAGESSGHLDTVFKRLALYTEAQEELKQKIQGALFYPAILLAAGILVVLMVVTFLIPQFVEIFQSAGVAMPLQTRILYAIGMGIKSYWHMLILAVLVVSAGVKWLLSTATGVRIQDTLALKVPVIGSLIRKVCVARFTRTLATLVASGVPILQSLELVQGVVGNHVIGHSIHEARQAVEGGSKLAEPLKTSGEFPNDAVQMIAIGEETGDLDGMLDKISDYYDRAVDYSVKALTTLIEPAFLVIMGCMVGFIMASVLFPIFDLASTLRR